MSEPRKWYVVCAVQPWSALEVSVNAGWSPIASGQLTDPDPKPGEPVGFLPVFDTKEEAEAWGEGLPIVTIQTAKEESDADAD